MAKEIEYKFLVDNAVAQTLAAQVLALGAVGEKFVQGYINETGMTTRVRLAGGDKAFLTLKGRAEGISRDEFEYEIPRADGEALLQKYCGGRVVFKTRYQIPVGNHTWDMDIYHGPLQGLATAEVELVSEVEEFVLPSWVGRDISTAGGYTNEAMARSGLPTNVS